MTDQPQRCTLFTGSPAMCYCPACEWDRTPRGVIYGYGLDAINWLDSATTVAGEWLVATVHAALDRVVGSGPDRLPVRPQWLADAEILKPPVEWFRQPLVEMPPSDVVEILQEGWASEPSAHICFNPDSCHICH